MKSIEKKIAEGRCRGFGKDYVPFYKANESSSLGTASMIPDPIEGRMVSVLSTTEKDFYYITRWDDTVEHIREQFLLDSEKINLAREKLGLRPVSGTRYAYTTDFVIDYKDGTRRAFSIKWKADMFNPDSPRYKYDKSKYYHLYIRQRIEQEYWESEGVKFNIVTSEDLDRRYAENIAFVMGFYSPRFILTREQKLMHLIAHKEYLVPMNEGKLNPKELADHAAIDIDEAYEKLLIEEEFEKIAKEKRI